MQQFAGTIDLPIMEGAFIRTTVSVPDKGTILLGGQRQINEIEIETGVPVLSKIPFINRFFTNRISSKDEKTLLILVSPSVIMTGSDGEPAELSGNIWLWGHADPDEGDVTVEIDAVGEPGDGAIALTRMGTVDTATGMWEVQAYGEKDVERLPLGSYAINIYKDSAHQQPYTVTLDRPFVTK